MKIRCIAVDDEPLALRKIHDYILRVGYLDLKAEFDNGLEALEFLKNNEVDLMFLDIQMEELTGIQMIEALTKKPKIILTTAYDEYAIKGYELDVCDYLLKPIAFQRFLKSCEKVHESLINEKHEKEEKVVSFSTPEENKSYFFVKDGSSTRKVNFKDILYVEGMKDYLQICTTKEKIMTLLSFKKLEEALPANQFIRIHKSHLIAFDKIDSIERNHVIINDKRFPVGDSYKKEFFDSVNSRKLN
ncbi:MAG: DNA-binding response regulator [Marinilabiliales bacterium]|nr:MAG: DNA-binding response regulator [Marinilabiliales bacterium]